jgi:crotonobetainyl-CoA:carnitine CoA-transferase CaiB-like acyl-CoA transferase
MAGRLEGKMPLSGIRVLDLSQVVAGPFCTSMLADMGAEVVKLERPHIGDDLRHVGRYEGRGVHEDYFNANNRTKKSIVLDLKIPADQAIALELAKRAHVLVENFAPGTAERLGLGWERVHAANPRLLYCSMSGFGQTGPFRHRLALDPIIQAVTGVMSVTGPPNGPPHMVGAPLADVISGLYAAYAIVSTLRLAEEDGIGRHIDISMQAAMLAALGPRMGQALQAGKSPSRIGNENLLRVPSNVYSTADGMFVSIMVTNDRHWPPFCRALDRPEWLEDPRFASMPLRARNRIDIHRLVAERIASEPYRHWSDALERERVPFARVNDYLEALAHPQVTHRGLIREVQHPTSGPIRVVGPPWLITDMETPVKSPPLLGEHTRDVLKLWLQLPDVEIDSIISRSAAARDDADQPR